MRAALPSPGAVDVRLARGFRALAVSTYLLLVVGATVRVHGAGMACPDWPLCFGDVIPQMDFRIFLEWGHRALAGIESVGLVVLGIAVGMRAELRAKVGGLVVASFLVLVAQIVLGGLTVLHLLADWSVTLHLLFGNLFCALLAVTGQRLADPAPREDAGPTWLGVVVVVATLAQMSLGALVSSRGAGVVCTEWPTCNGGVWFPALDGVVGLQIAHRLGAYTLVSLVAAFAFAMRRDALRGRAYGMLALVLVQVVLGVANVLLAMPVELAIAHSATADLLFLLGVTTTSSLLRRPRRAPRPDLVLERV